MVEVLPRRNVLEFGHIWVVSGPHDGKTKRTMVFRITFHSPHRHFCLNILRQLFAGVLTELGQGAAPRNENSIGNPSARIFEAPSDSEYRLDRKNYHSDHRVYRR